MTVTKTKKTPLHEIIPTHSELAKIFGIAIRTVSDRIASEQLAPTGSTLAAHINAAMTAKLSTYDPRTGGDLAAEKLRLTRAQAEKVENYNAKAKGEVVLASEVERALVAALAAVRAGLLSLPTDAGPELASITNKAECVALLKERIDSAMTSVAATSVADIVEQALKGSRPTDDDDVPFD